METATLTLSEFLLARIAEVEVDAEWVHSKVGCNWGLVEIFGNSECTCGYPARVLAECEAKRRIVAEHRRVPCGNSRHQNGEHCSVCSYDDIPREWHPCPTLRYLAAVYADHPDYRDEWKP